MYKIHEDASSNDHAYLENAADGLNPPVVLEHVSQKATWRLFWTTSFTDTPAKLMKRIEKGATK